MSDFDDRPHLMNAGPLLSETELALFSVAEIDHRIALLETEIARLRLERERKSAGRAAAEALFR